MAVTGFSWEVAIGFVALAGGLAAQYGAFRSWVGRTEQRLAEAEKDRELLHDRIGSKEAALEAQLKELTKAVNDLKVEVAVLAESRKRD